MTNRVHVLAACALTGLAACNDPTRPADPRPRLRPPLGAVEQQFTVRNLGTLGGDFSGANGSMSRAMWSASRRFPQGRTEHFSGAQGRACATSARWAERAAGPAASTTGARSSAPARFTPARTARAFLWSKAGGMRSLGTLGGE